MRIGTGLQNKLLEAMSMKIPTITTSLANDALTAKNSQDILIGDSANELAENIIKLMEDKALNEKIAEAGYKFVHKNHSWEKATEKLNVIINS